MLVTGDAVEQMFEKKHLAWHPDNDEDGNDEDSNNAPYLHYHYHLS